ncbi:MAG: ribonuclease HI family protein [Patescibacteria group bacterium]
MYKKLEIYCDGGARGNPGSAAIGVVIKDGNGKVLGSFGKTIGVATNNTAEYQAVIEALKFLIEHKIWGERTLFFLDSQVVARQLSREYKTKKSHLILLLSHTRSLEQIYKGRIEYHNINRSQNQEADVLVNQALDG